MLFTLALNPDIQDKLRKDVENVVKGNGYFDYNDICQLNYLDMILCGKFTHTIHCVLLTE